MRSDENDNIWEWLVALSKNKKTNAIRIGRVLIESEIRMWWKRLSHENIENNHSNNIKNIGKFDQCATFCSSFGILRQRYFCYLFDLCWCIASTIAHKYKYPAPVKRILLEKSALPLQETIAFFQTGENSGFYFGKMWTHDSSMTFKTTVPLLWQLCAPCDKKTFYLFTRNTHWSPTAEGKYGSVRWSYVGAKAGAKVDVSCPQCPETGKWKCKGFILTDSATKCWKRHSAA